VNAAGGGGGGAAFLVFTAGRCFRAFWRHTDSVHRAPWASGSIAVNAGPACRPFFGGTTQRGATGPSTVPVFGGRPDGCSPKKQLPNKVGVVEWLPHKSVKPPFAGLNAFTGQLNVTWAFLTRRYAIGQLFSICGFFLPLGPGRFLPLRFPSFPLWVWD